jgi:hypothetical protein
MTKAATLRPLEKGGIFSLVNRDNERVGEGERKGHVRVKAKGTCRCEGGQDTREADAKDGSPAHAYFTMGQREHFSGVGEGDRALSRRVEGREEVDEHGDEAEVCLVVFRDVEAEACGEEGPCLLRAVSRVLTGLFCGSSGRRTI